MAVQAPLRTKPVSRNEWRERLLFLAFLGPNVLLFAIFTYWPLVYNAYLSFVSWNFIRPEKRWVGLANYTRVLGDVQFHQIFMNTVVFTVASVGLTLLIGLGLALLINQPLRGRNGVRAIVFSPVILSGAAIGVVWVYIFDPRYGLLSEILGFIGIRSPNWLLDPAWAMSALIIVYTWKNLGYSVVIFLAGLQGIPRELYEAARVDGASVWARFWHVTLPGLSPVLFFLSVTSILACFQAFDIIKVMTNGGPVNATNTLIFHLYELGFVAFNAGRAGVVAVVLFLLMLIVTVIQIRFLERRVQYE